MAHRSCASKSSFRMLRLNQAQQPVSTGTCTLLKEDSIDLQVYPTTASEPDEQVVAADLTDYRAFATARHVMKEPDQEQQWGVVVAPSQCVLGQLAFIDTEEDLAVCFVLKSSLSAEIASLEGVGLTDDLAVADKLDIFGFPAGGFQGTWADRMDGSVVNLPGNVCFLDPQKISHRYEINGDIHHGISGPHNQLCEPKLATIIQGSGLFVAGGSVHKQGEADMAAVVVTKALNTSVVLDQVLKDSKLLAEVNKMSAWRLDDKKNMIPNSKVDLDGLLTRIAEETTRVTHLGRGEAIPVGVLKNFLAKQPPLYRELKAYPNVKETTGSVSAVYSLQGMVSTLIAFQ